MAIQSAGDSDPLFVQKHLASMKQRNYRQNLMLSHIRDTARTTDRPAFLNNTRAQTTNAAYEPEKLVDHRQAIVREMKKYI